MFGGKSVKTVSHQTVSLFLFIFTKRKSRKYTVHKCTVHEERSKSEFKVVTREGAEKTATKKTLFTPHRNNKKGSLRLMAQA